MDLSTPIGLSANHTHKVTPPTPHIPTDDSFSLQTKVTQDHDLLLLLTLPSPLPSLISLVLRYSPTNDLVSVDQSSTSAYFNVIRILHFVPNSSIPPGMTTFRLQVALRVDGKTGPFNPRDVSQAGVIGMLCMYIYGAGVTSLCTPEWSYIHLCSWPTCCCVLGCGIPGSLILQEGCELCIVSTRLTFPLVVPYYYATRSSDSYQCIWPTEHTMLCVSCRDLLFMRIYLYFFPHRYQ